MNIDARIRIFSDKELTKKTKQSARRTVGTRFSGESIIHEPIETYMYV